MPLYLTDKMLEVSCEVGKDPVLFISYSADKSGGIFQEGVLRICADTTDTEIERIHTHLGQYLMDKEARK